MEKVEKRDNYKLKLTLKDGHSIHVWFDAQTFLETRIEGQPRSLDGKEHSVEVYYGDFWPVSGLQIPFVLETKVIPVTIPSSKVVDLQIPAESIVIDKVVVKTQLQHCQRGA